MTPDHDPTMHLLGRLPPLEPNPARAERLRLRCRADLARRRARSERRALAVESGRRVLAPVLVGGICILYVVALVGTALRLRGGTTW